MHYTATVVGATGLVGSHLVKALCHDDNCMAIHILVRRKTDFTDPKIKEYIIDFDQQSAYEKYIQGDVLFSCLGTTRAQAGSAEKQYKVDYGYQYQAALHASLNQVKYYMLVSSPFAKIDSSNYYRSMKAQLEQAVQSLTFEKIVFIKPNALAGHRHQKRRGESFAVNLLNALAKVFPSLRKYRPIHGQKVAQAMLRAFYIAQSSAKHTLSFERSALDDLVK